MKCARPLIARRKHSSSLQWLRKSVCACQTPKSHRCTDPLLSCHLAKHQVLRRYAVLFVETNECMLPTAQYIVFECQFPRVTLRPVCIMQQACTSSLQLSPLFESTLDTDDKQIVTVKLFDKSNANSTTYQLIIPH
jgi:hypothetical protein